MELPFLHGVEPGPLQSGVVVAMVAVVAILLLRRIARSRPFTTNTTHVAFRASQVCVALLAVRVVLTAAPDEMPGLRSLSYMGTVALILALTWLAVKCIE